MREKVMSQSSDIIGSNETFFAFPDAQGHFGRFGGQFVSETLMAALDELRETYEQLKADPAFTAELASDLEHYVCLLYTSPSPRDQRGSRMPSSA